MRPLALAVVALLLVPAVAALPSLAPAQGLWLMVHDRLRQGEYLEMDAWVHTEGGEVAFLLGVFDENGTLYFDFPWTWGERLGGSPLGARAAAGGLVVDVGLPKPVLKGVQRFPVGMMCAEGVEECGGVTVLVAAGDHVSRIDPSVTATPGTNFTVTQGPATYARGGDFDDAAAAAHAGAASVTLSSNAVKRIDAQGRLFGYFEGGSSASMDGPSGRQRCDCRLASEPAGAYAFRLTGNAVNSNARLLAADLPFP